MLTPKKLKMSLETNSENNKMSPKITKNTKSGNKILTEIIEKISVCFEEIRNLNREKISDKPFLFEKSSLIEKIKNISFSNADNTTLINFFSEHVNEINVGNFVLSITKSFLNFGHFDQKNIQSLLKMLSKINLAVILRSGRQDLYTILSILLKSHFELNWDKNELITIYMTTMEEETDPSCLLKSFECFKLVIKTCKNSISEKTKKDLFSLIDRYFPINYQSENEDENLKTNLIKAFRECLTCDPLFVSLSFDFFCEKLCSLQNLEECNESALILTIFLQKYSYFVTKKFLRIAFDSFLETFKDDLSNEELQILCLNGIKIVAKKFFGISIFKSKSEFDIEKEISDLFQVLKMNKDSSSPEVTILIQIAESCSEANNIIMKQGWDELKRIFYTKEVHFPRLEGFMQVFYGAIDSNFANLAKTKILADNEKDICELFRSGLIGASPDVRALSLATLFKLSQIFSETFPKSNFFENQNIVTMATSLMLKDEAVSVKRQAAKSLLEMTAYHFSKNENNIRKDISYVKPEIWPFLVEKITTQQNCDETTTKVIEEFLQNSSNLHWSIYDTIFDSFIKTCLDFRYKENQMFVSKIFAVFAGITVSI
ncbi:mms19 nucleotide excision repair [Bonamia ostreae]|uniref:MMS19 nucleotide excision repair protein n=1 Tax=Bonamia ostreae TaxID=126728 RepID=A0ABV2AFV5_9EUKA